MVPRWKQQQEGARDMRHPDAFFASVIDPPATVTLEISLPGDSVTVEVSPATDLEKPFYGYCMDTGERLYFPTPWALDIEVA